MIFVPDSTNESVAVNFNIVIAIELAWIYLPSLESVGTASRAIYMEDIAFAHGSDGWSLTAVVNTTIRINGHGISVDKTNFA